MRKCVSTRQAASTSLRSAADDANDILSASHSRSGGSSSERCCKPYRLPVPVVLPIIFDQTLGSKRVQFPKNGWYAAIWSKDLAAAPVARTFLGENVVLFRGKSGKAAALEDRCCHRAA